MTFLPNVEHDVYVTFADADDEPLPPATTGWVTRLVDILGTLLRQAGISEVDIGMTLRGNTLATEGRVEALSRAGTVVVVLSPAYVRCPWFEDARVKEKLFELVSPANQRVFLVLKSDLTGEDAQLGPLATIDPVKFWRTDRGYSQTLGDPVPDPDTPYYDRVIDLVHSLYGALKRHSAQTEGDGTQNGSAPRVYLGETIAELEESRNVVARYLEQMGAEVVRRSLARLGNDPDPNGTEQLMRGARLFVQLLGRDAADDVEQLTRMRHELRTADQARSQGTRVIQWRPLALDLTKVTDASHKQVLLRATVRAESLPDFCQGLREALFEPAQVEAPVDGPLVYVDTRRQHVHSVQRIFGRYSAVQWDWHEKTLTALKAALRSADGVIVFWGDEDSAPVVDRFYEISRRWSALKKTRDRLRIYDGPPESKPPFDGSGFPIIEDREGAGPARLDAFIRSLSAGER